MRFDHPASGVVVNDAQIQAALTALGLTYTGQPSCPAPVSIPLSGSPLTKMQGEIVSALTKKPVLNLRQVSCLEIYWKAAMNEEPALAVDAVGTRLATQGVVNPRQATDFVRGSLRSFGRRLRSTLIKVPIQVGKDIVRDGVADEIPLLALFDISKGLTGEVRHRLTQNGIVAVQAALAMNGKGKAAASVMDEDYDPDEVVALAMTQGAAALIMRVAQTKGVGVDEAVRLMTMMMGAG